VPLATLMATLSKENGILAPALCALIELFVFAPAPGTSRARGSTAFIAAALVLPALAAIALTLAGTDAIVGGYANRPFTLTERLLTESRVLWSYVGSLLFPYGPKLGLYHDDYPISHGLLAPSTTLLAIAAWLATIGAAWRMRATAPGFGLGLGIFLVGQALESSVFPLLVYFEHRNYLPAIGATWALLSLAYVGIGHLRRHMDHGDRVFSAAGIGLVLVLGLATAARAGVWHSQDTLLAQGLASHPDSRWLRMDVSRWALLQRPPRWDVARAQVDHLIDSPDPDTRRMGAAARLWIDCANDAGARPENVAQAFQGTPGLMETDLLFTFESLGDLVAAKPCHGLAPLDMARGLQTMVDRSRLPPGDANLRRLRFKASQLYVKGGNLPAGLEQATLAYVDPIEDAPMAASIAQIDIALGRYDDARRMLDAADAGTPRDDLLAHDIIQGLRAQLREAESEPPAH